ncbi:hypothetical protein OF83DRAFT_821675 [Amylostereum chailletii]|nr:hypothetical protein OF83DRAFT_821675 [Amylostereum chailletii]
MRLRHAQLVTVTGSALKTGMRKETRGGDSEAFSSRRGRTPAPSSLRRFRVIHPSFIRAWAEALLPFILSPGWTLLDFCTHGGQRWKGPRSFGMGSRSQPRVASARGVCTYVCKRVLSRELWGRGRFVRGTCIELATAMDNSRRATAKFRGTSPGGVLGDKDRSPAAQHEDR